MQPAEPLGAHSRRLEFEEATIAPFSTSLLLAAFSLLDPNNNDVHFCHVDWFLDSYYTMANNDVKC